MLQLMFENQPNEAFEINTLNVYSSMYSIPVIMVSLERNSFTNFKKQYIQSIDGEEDKTKKVVYINIVKTVANQDDGTTNANEKTTYYKRYFYVVTLDGNNIKLVEKVGYDLLKKNSYNLKGQLVTFEDNTIGQIVEYLSDNKVSYEKEIEDLKIAGNFKIKFYIKSGEQTRWEALNALLYEYGLGLAPDFADEQKPYKVINLLKRDMLKLKGNEKQEFFKLFSFNNKEDNTYVKIFELNSWKASSLGITNVQKIERRNVLVENITKDDEHFPVSNIYYLCDYQMKKAKDLKVEDKDKKSKYKNMLYGEKALLNITKQQVGSSYMFFEDFNNKDNCERTARAFLQTEYMRKNYFIVSFKNSYQGQDSVTGFNLFECIKSCYSNLGKKFNLMDIIDYTQLPEEVLGDKVLLAKVVQEVLPTTNQVATKLYFYKDFTDADCDGKGVPIEEIVQRKFYVIKQTMVMDQAKLNPISLVKPSTWNTTIVSKNIKSMMDGYWRYSNGDASNFQGLLYCLKANGRLNFNQIANGARKNRGWGADFYTSSSAKSIRDSREEFENAMIDFNSYDNILFNLSNSLLNETDELELNKLKKTYEETQIKKDEAEKKMNDSYKKYQNEVNRGDEFDRYYSDIYMILPFATEEYKEYFESTDFIGDDEVYPPGPKGYPMKYNARYMMSGESRTKDNIKRVYLNQKQKSYLDQHFKMTSSYSEKKKKYYPITSQQFDIQLSLDPISVIGKYKLEETRYFLSFEKEKEPDKIHKEEGMYNDDFNSCNIEEHDRAFRVTAELYKIYDVSSEKLTFETYEDYKKFLEKHRKDFRNRDAMVREEADLTVQTGMQKTFTTKFGYRPDSGGARK